MPFITYQQVTQKKTRDQIQNRYHSDIARLARLGFEELCFYSETLPPFSCILFSPIILLMLVKKEVIKITNPLRITACYPLLVSGNRTACALVYSLGIKFYTHFTDGTALISLNRGLVIVLILPMKKENAINTHTLSLRRLYGMLIWKR